MAVRGAAVVADHPAGIQPPAARIGAGRSATWVSKSPDPQRARPIRQQGPPAGRKHRFGERRPARRARAVSAASVGSRARVGAYAAVRAPTRVLRVVGGPQEPVRHANPDFATRERRVVRSRTPTWSGASSISPRVSGGRSTRPAFTRRPGSVAPAAVSRADPVLAARRQAARTGSKRTRRAAGDDRRRGAKTSAAGETGAGSESRGGERRPGRRAQAGAGGESRGGGRWCRSGAPEPRRPSRSGTGEPERDGGAGGSRGGGCGRRGGGGARIAFP